MATHRRVHGPLAVLAILVAAALLLPTIALAAGPKTRSDDTLLRYARDTWASMVAMTDPSSGLPADSPPSNIPEGGYNAYGVDAIGMNPGGYPSNEDNTLVDHGAPGCPEFHPDPVPDPPPSAYTNGVITPHASFLALRWAPNTALANLAKLEHDFAIYGKWGFRDSVNVQTGAVSDAYLSLDQGIVMAAIGNALHHDMLRDAFATKPFTRALRPLISMETFNAGPGALAVDVDHP